MSDKEKAQLRALLAVARAAKTLHFFDAEYEGHRCRGVSGNCDKLTRALARLDAISERKR